MEELNNIAKYQKDIERIEVQGHQLLYGLYNELQDKIGDAFRKLSKEQKEEICKKSNQNCQSVFNNKF